MTTAAQSPVGPFASSEARTTPIRLSTRPVHLHIPLRETFFNTNRDCQTMANDIEDTVKSIIVEKLGVDESDVTTDASITNDLGADSLDTVELIMEFEKEFDLTIPDEEAEEIATVGDAIEYLEEKIA
jgi:acyl carrier protein